MKTTILRTDPHFTAKSFFLSILHSYPLENLRDGIVIAASKED